MRLLTDHKVNGLNDHLEVIAHDAPGSGGANHHYTIAGYQNDEPAERWPGGVRTPFVSTVLRFQNGPIQSAEDFNGLTNEALLAVLIDRMRGFQGLNRPNNLSEACAPHKFACRENAIALTHLEEALMWLQKRTRDRMARGVEGTLRA